MRQIQQSFQITIQKTVSFPYLMYTPKDYKGFEKEFPLVLFLHGGGEQGTDLDLVKLHGIPKEIEEGMELPFLVVSPQCPRDTI